MRTVHLLDTRVPILDRRVAPQPDFLTAERRATWLKACIRQASCRRAAFGLKESRFMTASGRLMRSAAVACTCVLITACSQDASRTPTATDGTAVASASGSPTGQISGTGTQAAFAIVDCEKEASGTLRSKISVKGNNLAQGRYRARVTSPPGSNAVVSTAERTIGDEVEFDFDSRVDPGETFIPASYIR